MVCFLGVVLVVLGLGFAMSGFALVSSPLEWLRLKSFLLWYVFGGHVLYLVGCVVLLVWVLLVVGE